MPGSFSFIGMSIASYLCAASMVFSQTAPASLQEMHERSLRHNESLEQRLRAIEDRLRRLESASGTRALHSEPSDPAMVPDGSAGPYSAITYRGKMWLLCVHRLDDRATRGARLSAAAVMQAWSSFERTRGRSSLGNEVVAMGFRPPGLIGSEPDTFWRRAADRSMSILANALERLSRDPQRTCT